MSGHLGRKVLGYAVLPGFIPRIVQLLRSSFSLSAYSIACIFYSVRLLPPTHPYVNSKNIGRFGLRHVMAAASEYLDLKWRNLDQIIIYFMILAGIVLLFAQFFLLVIGVAAQQPAFAALSDYFVRSADEHQQDLVMIVFDRIFGLSNFFESCISVAEVPCTDLYGNTSLDIGDNFPFAFHAAFHDMLSFYSYGLFYVATFVILYFVAVVVGETATTGSPFGQRYNKSWIPLRIILFFAFLVPFSVSSTDLYNKGGLNAAQLLTLWVAKTGSDFASNGWELFTNSLPDQGDLAQANLPAFDQVMSFILVARTCKAVEEVRLGPRDDDQVWIQPYVIRGGSSTIPIDDNSDVMPLPLVDTSYEDALAYAQGPSLEIAFGIYSDDENESVSSETEANPDHILPVCGRMSLAVSDRGLDISISEDDNTDYVSPAFQIQELYYSLLQDLWVDSEIVKTAQCFATRLSDLGLKREECSDILQDYGQSLRETLNDTHDSYHEQSQVIFDDYDQSIWNVQASLLARGWAGAALWYNLIADLNGRVSEALSNPPQIKAYPEVMEFVLQQKRKKDEHIAFSDIYNPTIKGQQSIDFTGHESYRIPAVILYDAYSVFNDKNSPFDESARQSNNTLMALVDLIFGAGGIYSIRENVAVNPLAQLSALGKAIMDASVRNIAYGTATEKLLPGLQKLLGDVDEKNLEKIGGAIQTVGYTGITVGFSLYYVLPLMPFIYFFFAFSGWIKSIFEAIVAMPLWAMSHITRWDGEGIAGPAAKNGYFLLLEIFLRPIMILFGLLASISIFSASVHVLNDIFDFVVVNVGGTNKMDLDFDDVSSGLVHTEGAINEFFYTVVYTVLVYMLGLSSFKMIDQVPNQILRWMNFTTDTFHEANTNAAEELSRSASRTMNISTSKLSGLTTAEKLAL